jgi:hypothetical protein
MPIDEPSFSTKPLAESAEPKIKKPRRKKIIRPSESSAQSMEAIKQTKISKQLTQIYQDEQGHLPDMKRIKIKKKRSAFKTFLGILLFGGILAAMAWIGLFFLPNNKKFSENKVDLHISGPTSIIAGTTTTYKIIYENNQATPLKIATLNVQYPESFVFVSSDLDAKNAGHTEWQLGEIGAGKKKEINITGITYGSINQKQSWRVFLTYQPENFGSELQKSTILDTVVDRSPFSLTVNGSDKTLVGNTSEYTFTIKKEYDSAIDKLEIKPSWPKTFVITSSSPLISKDFKWTIEPNKKPSTSTTAGIWTFKITGKFSNSNGTTTPTADNTTESANDISGAILVTTNNKTYTLTDSKITTELSQNNLDFNLAINGALSNFNIQPGGDLNITLTLKNQSANNLKDATIKLGLNGPAIQKLTLLDWSKIEDKYDGDIQGKQINDTLRRGEITWNKNKIPALANLGKGQEVTIDIKLPIKDAASFGNLSDLGSSSQITVLADLGFKDANNNSQTASSNQIVITVNSDLKFEPRDNVSGSGNGAIHQINWVLTNNFHPLKNITLLADVYGDAKVELPATAPAGEVNFNASSKKITWNIPSMPESVDVLALPITITVNKANPTQELLVSKVHIQAEDTVTGEKLDFMGDEIKLNQ